MATEEELDQQAPADQQGGEPQVPGAIPVDLSDDDDDDAPASPAEKTADRKAKRSWKHEMRENLKRTQTEAEEAKRERDQLRAEMAGLRGAMAAQRPQEAQRQQVDRPDPVEAELESIQDQQQALLARMGREGVTENEAADLQKKYWGLQRKAVRVAARAEAAAVAPQRGDEGGMSTEMLNTMMEADFPEAFRSESRRAECRMELVKRAERGERVTPALARQIAKLVHERYSRKSAPSDADRAKHINTPGRAGAGAAQTATLDPQTYKRALVNARGLYAHREDWSDERKVKEWMKKVGSKIGVGK